MTQQGFEDYIFAVYGHSNGTAKSYITAIHIIDEMFAFDDVFALEGKSITCIDDLGLLKQIANYVCSQQTLFKKGKDSFFRNINDRQNSYPGKGFCSAAIKQLLKYYAYDQDEEKAWAFIRLKKKGKEVSKELSTLFKIDKEGVDVSTYTKARLGQSYFRKMVLENYGNRCCVTGLNVPQTLRASHIVAWASDKSNRMNPENGLCLSATYDAAFDKHLISFDDDYRMILSKSIKEYFTNDVSREYFEKYEGKKIILPSLYMPNKRLLEKHRNLMG
jgi:putative restriction endonuclease